MPGGFGIPVAAVARAYLRIRRWSRISDVLNRRWPKVTVEIVESVEQSLNEAMDLAAEEWSRTPSAPS